MTGDAGVDQLTLYHSLLICDPINFGVTPLCVGIVHQGLGIAASFVVLSNTLGFQRVVQDSAPPD